MNAQSLKTVILILLPFLISTSVFAATPSKEPAVQYNCVEVSAENGNINWVSVAKDPQIEFVYIRATNGKEADPMYKKNLQKIQKTGLKKSFVLHMNTNSSVMSQFEFFCATVKPYDCDVYPAVFVDENKNWGKKFADNLSWMISYLTDRYGGAIIYSTEAFYNKYCNTELNNSLPIMFFKPGKKEPVIKNAPTGTGYLIWMFDKKGEIKGVQTPVSLGRFHPDKNIGWITPEVKAETTEE
ncbi:MAG: hypothetical protein J5808_07715 [Paludibacteraceae bacterium]|nr:hypothetical protein [Paludibacteraceae bacterium]